MIIRTTYFENYLAHMQFFIFLFFFLLIQIFKFEKFIICNKVKIRNIINRYDTHKNYNTSLI